MMKKFILVFLLAALSSCSGNDDEKNSTRLSGEWMLINVDCYCAFAEDIDLQDFKLIFDDSGKTLRLDNPTEAYYYIAKTGTYTYNLERDIITIRGLNSAFKVAEESHKLILTLIDDPQIADDELVLTYQKI